MSNIIRFRDTDCKNCYKCLRSCPVKAISFAGHEQAQVIEKTCILCGNCLSVCPQNAKIVRNDVEKVRQWLTKKDKVYVSLAPSWVAAFENADPGNISSCLKSLGFTHVEETALGAVEVSKEYARHMSARTMTNIITTACPTVVSLVEKHYPDLIGYLAPVVSPMIAHARMLRATYGSRIRVVFIGPCLSKKEEASDVIHAGAVDAVLTFEELEEWMKADGLCATDIQSPAKIITEVGKTEAADVARLYPASGGILKTLDKKERGSFACIAIDGMDRCKAVLDSLRSGKAERYFIEMSACAGSCMEGPCKRQLAGGYLEERDRLLDSWRARAVCGRVADYIETGTNIAKKASRVQLARRFSDKKLVEPMPTEEIIRNILNSIGKFTPEKELNCGACGYPTCREKAVAVFQSKALPAMCMPYMQERAASMSNLILNTTPNAILALDMAGTIQEINHSARNLLRLGDEDVVGKSVFAYLDSAELAIALDERADAFDMPVSYDRHKIKVEQTLVFVKEQRLAVLILHDVTAEDAEKSALRKVREETVEIAQKVIEKQMRVAQEIASLLGETTAETKVALTRLKKSILPQ